MNQAQREILDDIFAAFYQTAELPKTTDFEILQRKRGRLGALDGMVQSQILTPQGGRLRFSPQDYLNSDTGRSDKNSIERIIPALVAIYESGPTASHALGKLKTALREEAGLQPSPIDLERILTVLTWLGICHGLVQRKFEGKIRTDAFAVSSQVLRINSIDEHLAALSGKDIPSAKNILALRAAAKPTAHAAQAFETPFNRYIRGEQIGQGGTGVVLKCNDDDGASFAVKLLDASKVSKEKLKRFKNEITFCERNLHPNILTVLDKGVVSTDGVASPFYVMPLYRHSLRQVLKKGLSAQVATNYFTQILDGVEAAHLQQVVHRDLKPENILVDAAGERLVIADFGAASFQQDDLYTAVETRDDRRLANFQYAAPEQKRRGAAVDHRADIFAVGLMLNELFTGQVPHGTGFLQIGTVSPENAFLDDMVEIMLRQDPGKRYQSISELKADYTRRSGAFLSEQKLSALKGTVVPATESDDPLLKDSPRLVGFDYSHGTLSLVLSCPVNDKWVYALRNMGSHTAVWGKGPEAFHFNGTTASISSSGDEREVQSIITHFKDWLPLANRRYSDIIHQEIAAELLERQRRLREQVAAEEKRQRLLKNIKI